MNVNHVQNDLLFAWDNMLASRAITIRNQELFQFLADMDTAEEAYLQNEDRDYRGVSLNRHEHCGVAMVAGSGGLVGSLILGLVFTNPVTAAAATIAGAILGTFGGGKVALVSTKREKRKDKAERISSDRALRLNEKIKDIGERIVFLQQQDATRNRIELRQLSAAQDYFRLNRDRYTSIFTIRIRST